MGDGPQTSVYKSLNGRELVKVDVQKVNDDFYSYDKNYSSLERKKKQTTYI